MRIFSKLIVVSIVVFMAQVALAFSVCIDPGHPSEVNSGETVSNGLQEVKICWQVSLLLKKKLVEAGVKVVMTKTSELQLVTNRRRAEIANENKVDMAIRLHADAGSGTGFTAYYPRKQGIKFGVTGPSKSVLEACDRVAKIFHPAFAKGLTGELRNNGLKGDESTFHGRIQGALTGSIFSKVPVLLIEMCFLTNKKDADWIRQEKNKEKMASALAAGILTVRNAKR